MDALVIGPGLGRDQSAVQIKELIIKKAKEIDIPIVFDADGIFVVQNNLDLVTGFSKAILTPNFNEFSRLRDILKVAPGKDECLNLSALLGCTIVQKGVNDVISNGKSVFICDYQGIPRRCGGQGDVLSGIMGTMICWADKQDVGGDQDIFACFEACKLVREAARRAFDQHKRSMIASYIIPHIGPAFQFLFDQ